MILCLSVYLGCFPFVWGGSQQHKETTKTMRISLRSSSNDEGPIRVWFLCISWEIIQVAGNSALNEMGPQNGGELLPGLKKKRKKKQAVVL